MREVLCAYCSQSVSSETGSQRLRSESGGAVLADCAELAVQRDWARRAGSVDECVSIFWESGSVGISRWTGSDATRTHAAAVWLSDLLLSYANYRIESMTRRYGRGECNVPEPCEFERRDENNTDLGDSSRMRCRNNRDTRRRSSMISASGSMFAISGVRFANWPQLKKRCWHRDISVSFDIAMMWRPYDLESIFSNKKLSVGFNLSNLGPR